MTKQETALKEANDEYYDRNSPHYLDNERYSWAVRTINNSMFCKKHATPRIDFNEKVKCTCMVENNHKPTIKDYLTVQN